jgi:hypothetical protein
VVETLGALVVLGPRLATPFLSFLARMHAPETTELLRQRGLAPESIAAVVAQISVGEEVVRLIYPALWVVAGGLLILLNAWLVRIYLARRVPGWIDEFGFERLSWPLGLRVALVATTPLLLVAPLRVVAYNLLLIEGACFALQGLAIVVFFARRLPLALRLVLILLTCAHAWSAHLLALAGLFDLWFDLRGLSAPAENAAE